MGSFLSKQQIDSDNYEKILSELDTEIQKLEIKLSDMKINGRRIGVLWIIYSTLLWIIYVIYYLYTLNPRYRLQTVEYPFFNLTPIFLGPLCIYYIRKGLNWTYHKRLAHLDIELTTLRKKQKLKVEELKKKTSYYTTRLLLERYDSNFEGYNRMKEKETAAKHQQGIHLQPKHKQKQQQTASKPQQLQQQQLVANQNQHNAKPTLSSKLQLTQQSNDQQQRQQHFKFQTIPNNNVAQPTIPHNLNHFYQLNKQQPQKWYDKLIDALVGDIGPETKYALICIHCYAHNGLILPQEVDTIQYTCPHCHQFNPSRKSRKLHPNGPVLPSSTQPQPTVSSTTSVNTLAPEASSLILNSSVAGSIKRVQPLNASSNQSLKENDLLKSGMNEMDGSDLIAKESKSDTFRTASSLPTTKD
ncbi:hypothetical protein BDF20DRAFT_206080 [Mycotypha africana]|uniref:uncharacterized protein n=1 Tax=Mycotypha africana TaxID=64632 RepID=UPI0023006075|nr:uncharacterized protein BDF20DRAFT_206080 [Mycotypha africana]KAI8967678.1 hypothetical protein BDF20DRAFT_206080 [Mycotypha africana]